MGCKCRPAGTGVGGQPAKFHIFRVTFLLGFARRELYAKWIARYWDGDRQDLLAILMALRITARMCIGASEGASGSAALRRAAPPHSPSALLASGLVTYARHVMQNAIMEPGWLIDSSIPQRLRLSHVRSLDGGWAHCHGLLHKPSFSHITDKQDLLAIKSTPDIPPAVFLARKPLQNLLERPRIRALRCPFHGSKPLPVVTGVNQPPK